MKDLNIKEFINYMSNKDYDLCKVYMSRKTNNKRDSEKRVTVEKASLEAHISKIDKSDDLYDYKYIDFSFYKENKVFLCVKYIIKNEQDKQDYISYHTYIKEYICESFIDVNENLSSISINSSTAIYNNKQKIYIFRDNNFYSIEEIESLLNNLVFL